MGAGGPGAELRANLIVEFFSASPLKIMIDGNLVFLLPPDDIINKRAYPTLDLMWGRGLSRQNGRWRMGGQFDCQLSSYFSDSSLKIMIDGNLVFPRSPDDIINNERTRGCT